jgi:hypothetical protein
MIAGQRKTIRVFSGAFAVEFLSAIICENLRRNWFGQLLIANC